MRCFSDPHCIWDGGETQIKSPRNRVSQRCPGSISSRCIFREWIPAFARMILFSAHFFRTTFIQDSNLQQPGRRVSIARFNNRLAHAFGASATFAGVTLRVQPFSTVSRVRLDFIIFQPATQTIIPPSSVSPFFRPTFNSGRRGNTNQVTPEPRFPAVSGVYFE